MSIDGKSNPPGGSLAPGFRFHPTDEELVSYYLKRKVLSRPFAVDAISDVDLYKVEPWDLPARSRIRSRDTEWYFFGSLDRKYSNRSKTNRATGQGYWKTTGKDRAVRRGARTIGMKKTLVFHVGRAPKGERTNWVMHEYRLEDEDLARAGVPQDAYVVCRIFQKHGPGPQNGAQYGAPFLEEEWEDDNKPTIDAAGGNFVFADGAHNDLDDDHHSNSLSQGQHLGIQNEATAHPVGLDDDKNIVASAAEHNSLPSQVSLDEVIDQLNEDIYLTELDAGMAVVVPTRTSGLLGSPQSPPMDDYLELNDFVKPLDVGEYSLGEFSMIESDQPFENLYGDDSNFGGLHGINEFTNAVERDVWVSRQHEPAFVEDSFYLEDVNIFDTTSSSVQADNGNLFFDALSIPSGVEQEGYVEMTDIMDPISSKFSDPDSLEELAAYFDAPEDNNIQSCTLDYTCFPEFSSQAATKLPIEEGGAADLGFLTSSKQLGADDVAGSSSSELTGSRGGQSVTISNAFENPDVNYKHGSSDKTIKGRLISMLGSIASPPALAAEPKAHGPNPAVVPTSNSIHISAGMIHINGLRMKGNREPWSGSKGEDVGILLSYDTARADIHGTSSGFAQLGKMHCSSVSVVVRSGYCLSFLSILFIAVFFKMGFLYFCKVN